MTLNKSSVLALATVFMAAAPVSAEVYTNHGGNYAGATNRGPNGRAQALDQVGTGFEHPAGRQMADGTIFVVGSTSYTDLVSYDGQPLGNTRIQLGCASGKITRTGFEWNVVRPEGYPEAHPYMVYATLLNGNRYRNMFHANVVEHKDSSGKSVAVVLGNYAQNNRAERYAIAYDPETCQPLSNTNLNEIQPVFGNVQTNNGANLDDHCENEQGHSAVHLGGDKVFEACGANGNGRDDAWVYVMRIIENPAGSPYKFSFANVSYARMDPREERSRPTAMLLAKMTVDAKAVDSSVLAKIGTVHTSGNTQPPNRGVKASLWTVDNDGVVSRDWVNLVEDMYAANPNYRSTQIRMNARALGADGHTVNVAATNSADLCYQRVQNRRRRGKGRASLHCVGTEFTNEGLELKSIPQDDLFQDGDATHQAMFAFNVGTDGAEETKSLLFSTSVNGNYASLSTLKVMNRDFESNKLVTSNKVNLGVAVDNAWISNIYGNNPNTQGRNFVSAFEVVNPNYGVAGAWHENTKTFVAVPATTRRLDPVMTEQMGMPYTEDKLALEMVLLPAITAPGQEPTLPTTSADNTDPRVADGGTTSACSVSDTRSGLSLLALLGLALVGIRRRRK